MTTKKGNDVWMPPGKFIRLCIKVVFGFLVLNCRFGKVWCERMPDLSKIPTPPTFIHEPNPREMFFVAEKSGSSLMIDHTSSTFGLREGKFRCKASGNPSVVYKWMKNKSPFDLDSPLIQSRITRKPGEGSFTINILHDDDEGVYKCSAQNDNGRAVDKDIKFTKAFINPMPASVETIAVNFGDPFEKQCSPPYSKPPARAYWILANGGNSQRRLFQTINNTNIAVHSDGKIYFQYVREEDNIAGFYYTCIAENFVLKDYKFGNQFNFDVIRNPAVRTSVEPYVLHQAQFYSPSKVTVLKGESLELYCIVAGFPDKIPDWYKNNKTLDYARISWNSNFRKSMKIDNVTFQDEGVYVCRFPHDSHLDKQFVVDVESAPYWLSQPPKNFNSTERSNIDFFCNAYGKPSPLYRFFKNGYLLKSGDSKHIITGNHLSIPMVLRGDNDAERIAVYQCEVSNQHGSLWTNFYLNILVPRPPRFIHEPNPDELFFKTEQPQISYESGSKFREGRFRCKTTGFPSVQYTWKKNNLTFDLNQMSNRVTEIPDEGSFIITRLRDHDQGVYQCFAKNDNGTAVDKPIKFTKAFIDFSMLSRNETIDVNFGDPFEKQCTRPRSNPPALAYWILANNPQNNKQFVFHTINYTNIASNADGTIFFQYVQDENNIPDFHYTCTSENPILKEYRFGEKFNFNVVKNPAIRTSLQPFIKAQPQFYSPNKVTVMKGGSLELFCIVSGYPDQIPNWFKNGGRIDYLRLSSNNNFRKSMRINDVTFQEDGNYTCQFPGNSDLDKTFIVAVESAPFWVDDPPKNLDSTEGSNVSFSCSAHGRPPPEYRFYKNGILIKPDDAKYRITDNNLSILQIQHGTTRETGDTAVYQCAVENQHGSLWTNFYLNIVNEETPLSNSSSYFL